MNKKIATKEFIENEILDLIIAFPNNGEKFWALLIRRIQNNCFTEQEVVKAFSIAIDMLNKEPLYIADIIQPILEARLHNIVD